MDMKELMDLKETFRKENGSKELLDLVKMMQAMQREKDRLGEILGKLNVEFDVLRMELIPEKMEEEDINSVVFDGIGRLQLTSDINATIPADQRDVAMVWLDENGYGDIVSRTVNSSTLKAFIKGLLKKGVELPDGVFKVTPFTRASITKV